MKYEIGAPSSHDDLFIKMKAFLANLTDRGWAVDVQNESEIYFHNSFSDYYAIRFIAVSYSGNTANPYYNVINPRVFFLVANKGYDPNQPFFDQPGINVRNFNAQKESLSAHDVNIADIYGYFPAANYIFAADDKNIWLSWGMENGFGRYLFLGSIDKSIDFNGGRVLSSSYFFNTNTISYSSTISNYSTGAWWNTKNASSRSRDKASPFSGGFYGYQSERIICANMFEQDDKWGETGGFYGYQQKSYDNARYNTNIHNVTVSTGNDDYPLYAVTPFNAGRMLHLGTSRYTGLNALVTPHYFIKNQENRFILAGKINAAKLASRQNFSNGQKFWYGDKCYLIADYGLGMTTAPTTACVALDITDA